MAKECGGITWAIEAAAIWDAINDDKWPATTVDEAINGGPATPIPDAKTEEKLSLEAMMVKLSAYGVPKHKLRQAAMVELGMVKIK